MSSLALAQQRGFAEWQRHLDQALPELVIHDLAKKLAEIEHRLARACRRARLAGLPWSRILDAGRRHPVVESMRQQDLGDRGRTPRGPSGRVGRQDGYDPSR